MTGSTISSTSAAITALPTSIEPPGPRPFRPGPRSPAWPLGHRRSVTGLRGPAVTRADQVDGARGSPCWLNPRPELEHPSEIVGIAPDLVNLSVHDPEDEGRGELLAAAMAGYAKETLLEAAIPRTATLSPSAITSWIDQVCSIRPKLANRARIPSGPAGSDGGPPCMVQVGAVIAHSSSTRPWVTRSNHLRAMRLLSSIVDIRLSP